MQEVATQLSIFAGVILEWLCELDMPTSICIQNSSDCTETAGLDTSSMTRTPRCRKRLMTPRFLAEVHRPTDAPSSATSCRTSKNPQSDASSTMYLFFLDAASFLQALTMASSLASPRFLGFLSTGWNRTSFRLKREAHVLVRSKPGAAKTLVRTL